MLLRIVTRILLSLRWNRAITVAAQNRRLALITYILSRDSHGAVPVASRDIKGDSPCLVAYVGCNSSHLVYTIS